MDFCVGSGKEHGEPGSLNLTLRVHMKGMGMGSQQMFFNQILQAVNSMAIHPMFSLARQMPVVLSVLQTEVGSERFSFVSKLVTLVGSTLCEPEPNVNGYNIIQYCHRSKR